MRLLRWAVALWGLLVGSVAGAAEVMQYRYNAPESPLDRRYVYQWKILETALEKTRATWGPYALIPAEPMTEARQTHELKSKSGRITVMFLGTTKEMERELVPVRIPVDKNLGGYCVFLVRRADQARFADVRSLADLRRFTFGLGLGWLDADILRANGLQVVTGSSYDGLFEMLENERFDVFLRASVEVLDELEQRPELLDALAIEESIVLYYPMPMYFWFSQSPEGRALAARAEEGMRMMLLDGTYDRLFTEYQDHKIQRLRLSKRKIFRLENPLLSADTPFSDARLWFTPESYRPRR